MRRDTSRRTSNISKWYRIFIAAAVLALAGAVMLGAGFARYGVMQSKSSTPVGTTLTFKRSDASVEIAGIYTDEAQSVLMVRLTADEQSTLRLPYKGSDYRIFLSNEKIEGFAGREIPVLFGRYSTNGSFFLIIPKPNTRVYNIFVQNKNFVAYDDLTASATPSPSSGRPSATSGSSGSSGDMDDEAATRAIISAMDSYDYTDKDKAGKPLTVSGDETDMIGFRATLDPALSSEEYRPQVVSGTLLSDDGEFDFEHFFDEVFKDNATETVEADYAALSNQRKLLAQRETELKERIAANPGDTAAVSLLEKVQKRLAETDKDLQALTKTYREYDSVTYSDGMFRDLATSALVVPGSAMSNAASKGASK